MQDQMSAFIVGRTTVTTRNDVVDAIEFPTITFCFRPGTKKSIVRKLGINDSIYEIFRNHGDGETIVDTFDKISYQINEDFHIENYQSSVHNLKPLSIGTQTLSECYGQEGEPFEFTLQSLRTFPYGNCYKLNPEFQATFAPIRFCFQITLNANLQDTPDSLAVYITSNNSWYGVLDGGTWPQSKPLYQEIKFKEQYTALFVKVAERSYKEKLNENEDCFQKYFAAKNCSETCHIVSYPGLSTCSTDNATMCMNGNEWNNEAYWDCFLSDSITSYSLQDRLEKEIYGEVNSSTTTVYIGLPTMNKVIYEEVNILTLQDLIGSVGGSLGMFFGFSISTTFLYFINHVFP